MILSTVQGEAADSFYAVWVGASSSTGTVVTTEMETVVMRIDGDVLLDSLEAAPTLTPALNRTSTAPGEYVSPDEPKLIDDPRWVESSAPQR